MCPVGAVVMSWSLTQDVAASSSFNENYFLSLDLLNSVKTFSKNSNVLLVSKQGFK